jgi:phosphatidylglycerol---prolipoprotein diacylglyceryl transferase
LWRWSLEEPALTLGELFTALGFLTGITVLILSAGKGGIATQGMSKVAMAGLIGGIFGAKITQLLVEGWPSKVPFWAILDPKSGGKALMGGLLIGWISVVLAKWRLGIKRSTGDHFALALPAGEAIGRIGCFFNTCCYGRACDLPWAVQQHDAWRHPTQLYSSLTSALLFGFLLWLRPRLKREGDLWRCYLVGFGLSRFGLEFLRENDAALLGLSAMQWVCLELVVFAGIGHFMSLRRAQRDQVVA